MGRLLLGHHQPRQLHDAVQQLPAPGARGDDHPPGAVLLGIGGDGDGVLTEDRDLPHGGRVVEPGAVRLGRGPQGRERVGGPHPARFGDVEDLVAEAHPRPAPGRLGGGDEGTADAPGGVHVADVPQRLQVAVVDEPHQIEQLGAGLGRQFVP